MTEGFIHHRKLLGWLLRSKLWLHKPNNLPLEGKVRMSYQSHRMLTPGPTRKRKQIEPSLFSTSPKQFAPPAAVAFTPPQPQPAASNRMLAGYMAHEFLTKGTMLGQRFEPEVSPASSAGGLKRKVPALGDGEAEQKRKAESYGEVAKLLRNEGTHIPGIVNPTQLGRWIQM